VVRQFARLLAHGRRGRPLRQVVEDWGIALPTITPESGRFVLEESNVQERHTLFDTALALWERWPASFVKACRDRGAWHSNLMADVPSAPFWYQRAIKRDLFRPPNEIRTSVQHAAASATFASKAGI
jgi:hypothetical protein